MRRGRNSLVTGLPMVFMLVVTAWAMFENFVRFWSEGQWLLVLINSVLIALDIWMIVEALIVVKRLDRADAENPLGESVLADSRH